MHKAGPFRRPRFPLELLLAVLLAAQPGWAAEGEESGESGDQSRVRLGPPPLPTLEEVVVVGRLLSAAAMLTEERLADDSVSNLLSADDISRVGDGTVAIALRRVSGLTLVNNQFVYVRGLGERYSSTTLNGARIPSPDLTRSVVPLDLFPTSIVESLRIQKSYSPDIMASFGGGNINIRTKGLPDGPVLSLQLSTGMNTETPSETFSYNGGGQDNMGRDDGTRALSAELLDQIDRFRGDIGVSNILNTIRQQGQPGATFADAQQINRELATLLNRDISIKRKDTGPDFEARGFVGNSYFVGDELELGFLAGGAYQSQWRETTQVRRNIGDPLEQTDTEVESTYSVNITLNGNAGARFLDEHELVGSYLFLRNTDDETAVRTFFNANREVSTGTGFQNYRLLYEERELTVEQLRGTHTIGGATREFIADRLGFLESALGLVPEDVQIEWYISESDARTDIPNQVQVRGEGAADASGFIPIDQANVLSRSNAADYRFTTLTDDVDDSGLKVIVPLYLGDFFIDLSAGYANNRQARIYQQTQFDLGPITVADRSVLQGPLAEVFGDANVLDPANNFSFERTGTNSESYIAATMTDAAFFNADVTWRDTWRVSGGVRYEDYKQVGLDFNPYGYDINDPVVTTDPEELARAVFKADDLYPAISITYMSDWLAETFQLRFGYSETVTRPDLREITDASYVDPLTNDIVNGNPGVTPAEITNYDVRAEWFFSNGDQFTISLFYKDIDNPIEFFEAAASDTNVAREIVNAESAEVYGVEFELLKELGSLWEPLDPFFVNANLTLQESELIAGSEPDAPTNPQRDLVNASPWVVNFQLGFDSPDGIHSATLAYNVFGERLFVAGRNGSPDGFEQPFHSLNLTYQWYPTERTTVQLEAQNLLDDDLEIERAGVTAFQQDLGLTFQAQVQWSF